MSALTHFGADLGRLRLHQRAWQRKRLLREVYEDLYRQMSEWHSAVAGLHIDVGAGAGNYRRCRPDVLCCDVLPFPGLDFCADACRLPLADGTVADLTMMDVLHHLPFPRRFFDEVSRVLVPGGRLILVEPYVSPASWPVYKLFHREPLDLRIDPMPDDPDEPIVDPNTPLSANQAVPTLIFWRHRRRFERLYPELRLICTRPTAVLAYPLSGGFEGPCLVPGWAAGIVRRLDRAFTPLASFLAFRCLVVLEKG